MDDPNKRTTFGLRQPSYLISTLDAIKERLCFCPRAQTLLGYREKDSALVLICLSCKTWSCVICGRRKIAQLAGITEDAKPNRLLTLTIDPKLYPNPRTAFDATRRQIPELVRRLRKNFSPLDYLRVTELTKNGWPHYHMLVRSPYVPQPVVKKHWAELTGATIVDLREVKKTLDTYTYLVKYLSKLKHIEWTERHVSMSKGFDLRVKAPKEKADKLKNVHVVNQHPYNYLIDHYAGRRYQTSDPSSRIELLPDKEFIPFQQDLGF